jgi:CHAT domain-containing protein/tetratricopeptide (TPR) repeat protein
MSSWRVVFFLWAGIAAGFLTSAETAQGEAARLASLNSQVLQHFRGGNYKEAAALAERALAEAKSGAGENHPDTIKAMIQLGHALIADERSSDAGAQFSRALEIAQTALPADSLLLADALDGAGVASNPEGSPFGGLQHLSEIEALAKRSLAIREKNVKADPVAYLDIIQQMSSTAWLSSKGEEGERQLARAIGIAREQLGYGHPVVAGLLWKMGEITKYRSQTDNPAAYANDAQKGIFGSLDSLKEMMDAAKDPNGLNSDMFDEFSRELKKKIEQGSQYEKPSLAILDRLLKAGEIDSATPVTTPPFIAALSQLAADYQSKRRFADAERVHMIIRDMRPQTVNARYVFALKETWTKGMSGLLDVYQAQGRPTEFDKIAELMSAQYDAYIAKDPKKAGGVRVLGPNINDKLAQEYEQRGDFARAERFWTKEVAQLEASGDKKALADKLGGGSFMFQRDDALDGLAGFYERQKRWAEAEAAIKRAIAVRTEFRGAKHSEVAELNRQLALFRERRAGILPKEPYSTPRVVIPDPEEEEEKEEGAPPCDDEALLKSLDTPPGKVPYAEMGRETLPPGCTTKDVSRVGMEAWSKQAAKSETAVLFHSFRASEAYRKGDWKAAVEALVLASEKDFAERLSGKPSQALSMLWMDSELRPVPLPLMLVKAASRLAETAPASTAELLGTTFAAAQRSQLLSAAAALGQMTARQANGNTTLAMLVRERDALATEWSRLDQQAKQAVLQMTQRVKSNASATDRARMDEIPVRIAAIDKTLAQDFPDYVALAQPQPLSVAQVQSYLKPDEALVLLAATPRLGSSFHDEEAEAKLPKRLREGTAPAESFVWVVTKGDARWVKADLKGNLAQEIFTIRCGLDDAYWEGEARLRRRCEAVLRVQRTPGQKPPFHIHRAHALYRALFGQVEDLIKGKRLLIAPTGPYTVLPFQVLVTAQPGKTIPADAAPTDPAAYDGVAWLGTRQSLTVLPSVASLKALREHRRTPTAKRAFIGFGNPLLTGRPEIASHRQRAALVSEGLTCRRTAPAARQYLAMERPPSADSLLIRGRLADVSVLRQQLPLPETADELCTVAAKLGASEDDVLLGGRMTEATIKALSLRGALRNYRVLHFATHGLVASETEAFAKGEAEPALMFTPPQAASDTDDGLLTASEITQLELDADWVIMSACSTAAGESSESEALSGLARAFFYAGARSLLVSHWAVDSDAAVSITTGAFGALASSPGIGKGEALRRSLVALQKKGGANQHPATWAPFSLVGGEAD